MVTSNGMAATAVALLFSTAAYADQFVMYTPGGDDTAVERFDAIISPGKLSGHVHQIFGANGMNPSMSYDSLQDSSCTTVGSASGDGNADDNSVYWHPALYMEAKDGSGYVRIPTNGHKLYYQDAGSPNDKKADPFEFPPGFRMLAGDPFNRAAATSVHMQNVTQWICHKSDGTNQGTSGGFPTGVTDCDAYPGFNGAIQFPHCWNGEDFNQSAPTAHMSYAGSGTGDIVHGDCPASHPIRLPQIFVENQFNLHSMVDKVIPDTFVLAQGDPTGYGWHFDFYNGWKVGALSRLLDGGCPQGKYGNEDIGTCSVFAKSAVKDNKCQLTTTFVENVDTPGKYLPGCNPVTSINPAVPMAVAALGISTDQCTPAGSFTGGDSNVTSVISSAVSAATSLVASATSAAASVVSSVVAAASSDLSSITNTLDSDDSLCPSKNGTTFTDPTSGKSFEIECGIDHYEGNLHMKYVASSSGGDLTSCIAECAAVDNCVDVSLSGTACYLKSSLGAAISNPGIMGARLITNSGASPTVSAASTTSSAASVNIVAAQANNNMVVVPAAQNGVVTVVVDEVVTQWVTVFATATGAPQARRDLENRAEQARHDHAQMHARAAGHGSHHV